MLVKIFIILSSLSFLGYGIAYFKSVKMKNEFKRFGLENFGSLVAVLEILGALGLLIGLQYWIILVIASGGLALLMLLGIAVRIKIKDRPTEMLPAFFFFLLNGYIFINALALF